jgi:hypothetical protein
VSTNLVVLVGFGIAFGFGESAVAYDLRDLMSFHEIFPITPSRVILNLGLIRFVVPHGVELVSDAVTRVEIAREATTIAMLLAIAFLAGRNLAQRVGAFLLSFACWDISYYGFLKLLTNWPASLKTTDVYFLIPVAWVGPVVTPLVASAAMAVLGGWLYLRSAG